MSSIQNRSESNVVRPSRPIPASATALISPAALLQAYLSQDPPKRPSGRSITQAQAINLNAGSLTHCNGSAVVKIGNSTVVCGVRAEILTVSDIPSFDSRSSERILQSPQDQSEGLAAVTTKTSKPTPLSAKTPILDPSQNPISLYNLLVPNLALDTGCSPLHPPNTQPSSEAQTLAHRLHSLLLTSHVIHPSDLAVAYTAPPEADLELDPDDPAYVDCSPTIKAFWTLYIDCVCLSHGGEASVYDAAWFAIYAALKDTILPRTWWDEDEKRVLSSPDVDLSRRLAVRGMPVPLGFGVFVERGRGGRQLGVVSDTGGDGDGSEQPEQRGKGWILIDPDAFEEESCEERGCVTVDLSATASGSPSNEDMVRLEKNGGGVVGPADMKKILQIAHTRWREWKALLDKAIVAGPG